LCDEETNWLNFLRASVYLNTASFCRCVFLVTYDCIANKTANGALRDTAHSLYQGMLSFQTVILPLYTLKCNFIYPHKNITAFPMLILKKFTNYRRISCTYFHSTQILNVERADRLYAGAAK
jgi:uncharacterized membrane protein